MKLGHATWPQVEEYLKKNKTLILPIGSTEQHGPTGLLGTDYITAQEIAEEVGKRLNVYVAPPICVGMALHHMAFPGSCSLSPSTLLKVIVEIVESYKRHGFKKFYFVNGHGGNIPTVTAAFSEIKNDEDDSVLDIISWWRLAEVEAYEKNHFGNENGFHATIGEVSVTMHLAPEAFEKIEKKNFTIESPKHHWPLSPKEFRKTFYDGRMESNPGLATAAHGAEIFEIAVRTIAQRISDAY